MNNSELIGAAKAQADTYARRLKYTSIALIGLGAVSAVGALFHGFNAVKTADWLLHGRHPRPPHPHPNNTWDMPPPPQDEDMQPHHEWFVERDEFALYDSIKTISFVAMILSLCFVALGKKGLRAIWMKKPKMTRRLFKKSGFKLIFMFLISMVLHHQVKEAVDIVKHHHHPSPHNATEETDTVSSVWVEQPEEFPMRRQLNVVDDYVNTYLPEEVRAYLPKDFGGYAAVDCRSTYSDQSSCDADALCSWCTSGAVKPACNSLEDAKTLPPAVFKCDKVAVEEPVQFEDIINPQNGCDANTDADSCDAVSDCTWCKSAAVKSGCKSIEDAKTLPASIFSCDKLQEEFPPMRDERHHRGEPKRPIADEQGSDFEGYLNIIRGKAYPKVVGQCSEFANADSCDDAQDCTWCRSAAVKSSCKTVEDAKTLPSSIFSCDKLQEEDGADFMKGLYGDDLRSAFKHRDEEDEEDFGMEDDEDRRDHHDRHHHRGRHGCCVFPMLVLALIATHMWSLYKLANFHRQVEQLGGNYNGDRRCGGKKDKKEKKVQQEQSIAQQSSSLNESTNNVLEYSICDHSEQDKEGFPDVAAPTATHYLINNSAHNMV
jgi:hypothetical protein